MIYVYLAYGLSFFFLGAAMVLQVFSAIRILPKMPLALLAGFGFAHSLVEFQKMFQLLEMRGSPGASPVGIDQAAVILLLVSFLFLWGFGLELLIDGKARLRSFRFSYVFLPAVASLATVASQRSSSASPESWPFYLELYARYLIGFPSGMLATFALWKVARRIEGQSRASLVRGIYGSAVALFIYSLAAGFPTAIPKMVGGFPEHGIFVPFGLVMLRAFLAVCLSLFLSYSFFLELSKIDSALRRMRDEFSSVLAHDVRNILGSIKLASDVLVSDRHSENLDERFIRLLKSLNANTKLLQNLISEMFDLNLIELNRFTLAKRSEDLVSLVLQACQQMHLTIVDRTLTVHLPSRVFPVEVDRRRIDQILINLLSNAGKYSYPETEILVEAGEAGTYFFVVVTSFGPPISPLEANRLFARYYRRDGSKMQSGTGLGLFIVKELVEAHGGKVIVETDQSGRSSFGFSLPRAQGEWLQPTGS